MNFITDALDWFQEQREEHTTEYVYVGTSRDSACGFPATITQPDTESTEQGVKKQTQYFHFVIATWRLKKANIVIDRDTLVWWKDDVFRVTFKGGSKNTYNDPLQVDTVLVTQLKTDA